MIGTLSQTGIFITVQLSGADNFGHCAFHSGALPLIIHSEDWPLASPVFGFN